MLYGSPCKFLGICSGYDSPDSDKWQRKTQVHNELPIIDGDGRDYLSNSRIRSFQTCRRKHYYEYELGIERQDDEERECLVFGTLLHSALNQWWCFFMEEQR
jgi:ATP-dependent helicase/DNAse subunit B